MVSQLKNFYKNKIVFITGHTGFKGTWLSLFLIHLGAKVIGYSLKPIINPNLYSITKIKNKISSNYGDIRNYKLLNETLNKYKPEIIFHMAAQPLVLESYKSPHYTYETNIMGTLNILEIIRNTNYVKSFINITTDKVYKNKETMTGYRENEELDGFDPYSNSKSCSELITKTYVRSLIKNKVAISTVRAGNVIGGGDFSENRIIPDCTKALFSNKCIEIRNPNSIRPYQHVLEPIFSYILLAFKQYHDYSIGDNYNVGPDIQDTVKTKDLVELFCEHSYKDLKVKYSKKQ